MHPEDASLPIPHPLITKFLQPPPKVVERSKKTLQDLNVFEVKIVPPKQKRVKGANAANFGTDTTLDIDALLGPSQFGTNGVKSNFSQSQSQNASQKASQKAGVSGNGPSETQERQERTVGLDDPIGNFDQLIEKAGPLQAQQIFSDCKSQSLNVALLTKEVVLSIIPEIIKSSKARDVVAIQAMGTARQHAIEEERYGEYNEWLYRFKKSLSDKSNKRKDFWERICSEGNLGLITFLELEVRQSPFLRGKVTLSVEHLQEIPESTSKDAGAVAQVEATKVSTYFFLVHIISSEHFGAVLYPLLIVYFIACPVVSGKHTQCR